MNSFKFKGSKYFSNFMKSKTSFNVFNSSSNSQRSLINFSNKYFVERTLSLCHLNKLSNSNSKISTLLINELENSEETSNQDTALTSLFLNENSLILNDFLLRSNGMIYH